MKTIFYIKREKDVTPIFFLSFASAMRDLHFFPLAFKDLIFARSLSKLFFIFVC